MSENDYRSIFISESREHIVEIFSDLSKIERSGKAEERLLFDMFRRFHTLKGMANTMDQKELGKIAHLMEEMLEYIRKDPESVSSFIEFIRKGINGISNEIDNYENSNPFQSYEMIKELEYIIGEMKKRLSGGSVEDSSAGQITRDLSSTFELVFQILPESKSPTVRAFMLLREFSKFNPVITKPDVAQLKSGEKPDFVKIYLRREIDEKELSSIISRVSEVKLHLKRWYKDEKDQKSQTVKYIRIPFERVEDLTSSLDELFLLWNKYRYSLKDGEIDPLVYRMEYGFKKILNYAGRMRTVPAGSIVPKLSSVVQSTAKQLGKKVVLEVQNEEIEIDKSIIDRLEEPLLHIIRNGIYHGIEEQSERVSKGKSENGKINIIFSDREEYIEILIKDDGAGLNRERILNSAIEKGIIKSQDVASMRDEEIYELIFVPGFSTLRDADMTSGRGFGMDIVRNVLWQMGGDVVISTRRDCGTEVSLRVPYQFASRKVIVASIGDFRYAFPLVDIEGVCKSDDIEFSDDRISLFRNNKKYNILNSKYKKAKMFLLCSIKGSYIAIGIDDIVFIGETRLYNVPYLLKSGKFINGMIVINGIWPVPIISAGYFLSEGIV